MENVPYVWVKAGSHNQHALVMLSYLLIFHRCATAYTFPLLHCCTAWNKYVFIALRCCLPFFSLVHFWYIATPCLSV